MLFDLNAPVDLGSREVAHSVDEQKFAVKNTLPFNGVLSNYHSISSKGWPTTNGEPINLVSLEDNEATFKHRNKEYVINNAKKVLSKKEEIKLPFNEDILEYFITEDKDIYVRTEKHILKRSGEGEYDVVFDIEKAPDGKYKSFFFTVNRDGIIWYDNGFRRISDINTIIKKTSFVFFNGDTRILEEPNNGYYTDEYWVVGHDGSDHSKDWGEFSVGHHIDYIGHVTSNGVVIGEPRPDKLKPTVLPNKLIKWDRFNESDLPTLKTANESLATGAEPSLQSETSTFGSSYKTPTPVAYTFIFGMNRSGSLLTITNWSATNSYMMIDTVATPGIYWQTESDDDYTPYFPNTAIYTNNIEARGRDYEYYGDTFRCIYNHRLWRVTASVLSIMSTPVELFHWEKGKSFTTVLDNTNAQAIQYSGGKRLNKWAVPTPTDTGDYYIANSTVWFKDTGDTKWLKHHLFTKAQANNRAWSAWRNTADFNVDAFPLSETLQDGYVLHKYQNLPICISRDGVTITTPTTEMDEVYFCRGDLLISNKTIFTFEDITVDNIRVDKISDYKFKTNIVAPLNVFSEKRDGSIELVHSFIPYFNEVKWNGYGSLALLQCPDGNDYNDTFSIGFGVNATLDDNTVETSALLPAISIPFYCNSKNIAAFNNSVIEKKAPIVVPDTALIPEDVPLGVYFTHALKSTEVSYVYSEKNNEIYNDEKYENTQWWIGSNTIFLPLGLGSTFSGINYLASTVELPGNYSVRLYTQNNNSFLLYNIAQQSYYGQTIFTIYGSSYYYDGQGIYYIGDGTSNEFVCYAIGMKFLANSGTEAYFYSPVDKYLYTFTGSNTLTKGIPLSNVPAIKDAVFSSVDQTLYLLFEDDSLYAQNGISSAYFTNFSNIKELQGTVKGCAILSNEVSYDIVNPEEGEVLPINVETEYTGGDDYIWRCPYVDLMLIDNGNNIKATVQVDMLGTDKVTTHKKVINISKSDFKNRYLKVRVSPSCNQGQAFKFTVKSDDNISIASISPRIERVSEAGFTGLNY